MSPLWLVFAVLRPIAEAAVDYIEGRTDDNPLLPGHPAQLRSAEALERARKRKTAILEEEDERPR